MFFLGSITDLVVDTINPFLSIQYQIKSPHFDTCNMQFTTSQSKLRGHEGQKKEKKKK